MGDITIIAQDYITILPYANTLIHTSFY